MAKKAFNPNPNYHLAEEPEIEIAQEALDQHAPNAVWTESGVDDLRVGDLISIRQCLPVAVGRGSHKQPIYSKVPGYNHRMVKQKKEYRCIAEVQRVYDRRTRAEGRTAQMVQYAILWDSDHDLMNRTSNSIGQAKIVEENGKPYGKRQLEVRRLQGSGPSRESRRNLSAVEHSVIARAAQFRDLWETVPTSAIVLNGNPFVDPDKREPVEIDEVNAWISGAKEVPAWAMNIIIKERDKADAGELPAGLAKAEDAPPLEAPIIEENLAPAPEAVEEPVAVETPIAVELKPDPLDVIEARPKSARDEGSLQDHLDAARARMRAIAAQETSFITDPEAEAEDEVSDWEDAA